MSANGRDVIGKPKDGVNAIRRESHANAWCSFRMLSYLLAGIADHEDERAAPRLPMISCLSERLGSSVVGMGEDFRRQLQISGIRAILLSLCCGA